MRIRLLSLTASTFIFASVSNAALTDQHSVEAISQAIASPIPGSTLEEARKYDDQLLSSGTSNGRKVYLVTDARSGHALQLVNHLLVAMGEDPSGWVVRVLDTDPKMENAFVVGGKYIYIYTGLLDNVKSDDELAFVVGHEMGHSILKHNLRRKDDTGEMLANLAALVAATSSNGSQRNAQAISQAIHSSYGQADEREADTFGVIATWRAGFDPLRGVDFFSRIERSQDQLKDERDKKLDELHQLAVAIGEECQSAMQQWNSGQIPRIEQNAMAVNQRCEAAKQNAQTYNKALAEAQVEDSNRQLAKLTSDHPDPQERIAAVAALTDYLHGVRTVDSLGSHAQSQRVITALLQRDSALLKRPAAVEAKASTAVAASAQPELSSIEATLQKLKGMYQGGLIEQADYEKKKQELLGQL